MLVKPQSSAHWYSADLQPAYEIPRKDGKGLRKPTVADARKLGLLPSVTSICGILAKPQLTAWLQTQSITAALTLPRLEAESVDKFAERIVDDMDTVSAKAREFGTRIHSALEWWLVSAAQAQGAIVAKTEPDIEAFLNPPFRWLHANIKQVIAAECVVGDVMLGFAGKLDLRAILTDGREAVIDFKTSSSMQPYPEMPLQLAAYGHCVKGKDPDWPALLTVLISSKDPTLDVVVKEWENPQFYFERFLDCKRLWEYLNNYPRKE